LPIKKRYYFISKKIKIKRVMAKFGILKILKRENLIKRGDRGRRRKVLVLKERRTHSTEQREGCDNE